MAKNFGPWSKEIMAALTAAFEANPPSTADQRTAILTAQGFLYDAQAQRWYRND